MSVTKDDGIVAILALLAMGAFLYSVLHQQRLLSGLGLGIGSVCVVLACSRHYTETNRRTLTRTTIILTLIYGLLTFQFPVAVVAACIAYLTAWVTGPDSPLDAPETQIIPVEGPGVGSAGDVFAWLLHSRKTNRRTLAQMTIISTLVYGLFTFQLPVAVVAACIAYLTAWVTGPDSPLDAPETQIIPVDVATFAESDTSE